MSSSSSSSLYHLHNHNLISSDIDCGGGICDPDSCTCICTGCLEPSPSSSDNSCILACDCGLACSTYNLTGDPDETDWNNGRCCQDHAEFATCKNGCDVFENAQNPNCTYCPECVVGWDPCPQDMDCISTTGDYSDNQTGICVDSGLCTRAKEALCDDAYEAVAGNTNNRAKCCPATSGCIKNEIGVVKTATCGTNCGACLVGEVSPCCGSYKNHMPSTFCKFGQRLGENFLP